jgi:hypothetical protein
MIRYYFPGAVPNRKGVLACFLGYLNLVGAGAGCAQAIGWAPRGCATRWRSW